jgi:hypothetical protein
MRLYWETVCVIRWYDQSKVRFRLQGLLSWRWSHIFLRNFRNSPQGYTGPELRSVQPTVWKGGIILFKKEHVCVSNWHALTRSNQRNIVNTWACLLSYTSSIVEIEWPQFRKFWKPLVTTWTACNTDWYLLLLSLSDWRSSRSRFPLHSWLLLIKNFN